MFNWLWRLLAQPHEEEHQQIARELESLEGGQRRQTEEIRKMRTRLEAESTFFEPTDTP